MTGWTQTIYYAITIRAGDPRPQPNTARWAEHRRRIHMLVVGAYLLYTLYEADHDLRRASDFYQDLGVPLAASDREIKSRFRRLAALHHPDKTGGDYDGAEYFMHLKTAADTLTDPARRFAYERFGPDVVEWKHCATVRDFVLRGTQQLVPYYGAAAAFMYVLGLFGYLEFGRYWRWLTLAALAVFEVHTVTRPAFPRLAAALVNPLLARFTRHPPYLPFQLIGLARKASVTLHIAFSQLGPLLQRGAHQQDAADDKLLRQGLERLEQTARAMDADASRLMELEMTPFAGDADVLVTMRTKLKEWLVQNTIRSDPMVRDALGRSLKKRRVDAPAGARGNR